MEWLARYGSKYSQFVKAQQAGIRIEAMATRPYLNELESFYFMAYQQVGNSGFSDLESFCKMHEVDADELEDMVYYFGVMRENESKRKG